MGGLNALETGYIFQIITWVYYPVAQTTAPNFYASDTNQSIVLVAMDLD